MYDVHWKEGMLLLPQHIQLFRRGLDERVGRSGRLGGPARYGVRSLEWRLNTEELGIEAAEIVFPGGTVLATPGECTVPAVPVGEALERQRGGVGVWIGVPQYQEGVSVVRDERNRMGRYVVRTITVRDEVDSGVDSERQVEVRRLNARLFLDGEDRSGYESMRIARLRRKSELDPEPMLDPLFVPPLVDVTADPGLKRRLTEICDALRETNRALARDVSSRPFSFALESGASPEAIFKLNATNAQMATIEQLCLTRGVHPFDTYLALCQLAGSLAIFSDERRCPELPAYDHDELEVCFRQVIGQIKTYLDYTWSRVFESRPFELEEPGAHPRARLDPDWLEAGASLYLAARSEEHRPDDLDAVIGQRVKLFGAGDAAATHALPGVKLQRELRVPAALPELTDVYYYRLDRDATRPERWAALRETLSAELVWTTGESAPDVDFYLYAVPRS